MTTEETMAATAGEVAEQSTTVNPAGVYVHPQTGVIAVARYHPKFGAVQADAYIRTGYIYDRPATAEDLAEPTFGNLSPVMNDALAKDVTTRGNDSMPTAQYEEISKVIAAQATEIARLSAMFDGSANTNSENIQSPEQEAAEQAADLSDADLKKQEDADKKTIEAREKAKVEAAEKSADKTVVVNKNNK